MTWIDQDSFPLRTLLSLSLFLSRTISFFFRAATDYFNYPVNRAGRKFFDKISRIPTTRCHSVKNEGRMDVTNRFRLISGNMGVHPLPQEARVAVEDRAMDNEGGPGCRGQRDGATNAGHAGGWSSGTRGPNSG